SPHADGKSTRPVRGLHDSRSDCRTRAEDGIAPDEGTSGTAPRRASENGGSGQGVSPERICGRMPEQKHSAAGSVQGGCESRGTGRADDWQGELSLQPENPQAGGRNFWLDQDGGRVEA